MLTFPGISPLWMWIGFIVLVVIMLEIDLGVFNRKDHVIGIRESLLWTCVWIALSLVFNAVLWWQFGSEIALEYFTGYLIEKSLSMDNLFVFLMIFTAFGIPRIYQHRVLYWGILGAIVMRGIFIALGAALVSRFDWVFLLFGAILVVSAYRMEFSKERKFDPDRNLAVRLVRKVFPVTKRLDGHKFFVVEHGKRAATILFVALITIELTDVVFATDSIPAIFGVTTDPFIVFTSNIFAILGLRALYFAIAGLHAMFVYLKTGLAFILAFIGVKMLLFKWIHIPILWSLAVIVSVLALSIIVSVLKMKGENHSRQLIETHDGKTRVHVSRQKLREMRSRVRKERAERGR